MMQQMLDMHFPNGVVLVGIDKHGNALTQCYNPRKIKLLDDVGQMGLAYVVGQTVMASQQRAEKAAINDTLNLPPEMPGANRIIQ